MSKFNSIRLISFSFSLAVIFAAVSLYYGIKSERYEQSLNSISEMAFSQLVYSTEEIQKGVNAMQYGTDGVALSSAAAQVWSASQSAGAALSSIPVNDAHLLQCQKLINQIGDYSLSLLMQASGGKPVSEKQLSALKNISGSLSSFNMSISNIKEQIDAGELVFTNTSLSDTKTLVSTELKRIEMDFPTYDELNYAGDFSDHTGTLSSKYTQYMEDSGKEQASLSAAKALNVPVNSLELIYETDGTVPVYAFSSGDKTVEVTKKGAVVSSVSVRRFVTQSNISADDAKQKALQFANNMGFSGLVCRYASVNSNVLTAELIFSENGVTYYPDRVTVGVAMDNGEIISFNASKYIMSHATRNLTLPESTPEGAYLAVIPTAGQNEHLCYEYENDDHLKYVCCESGSCYAVHPFEKGEADGLVKR